MKPTKNTQPPPATSCDPYSNCTCCRHSRIAELPSNLEWAEQERERAASDEDRPALELPPKPTVRLTP
jgi:hypothetical protein